METLQETVTYREDTGAATKPTDKNLYDSMAQQDESNYVDLNGLGDIKEEGAKTIKVTFTGEGNRPAIFRRNSNSQSTSEDQTPGDRDLNDDAADLPAANCRSITEKDVGGDKADDIIRDTTGSFEASSSCEMPDKSFRGCLELSTENRDAVPGSQIVPRKFNPEMGSINKEELQYSDMYISRKSDPVGGVGVVLSYHRMPSVTDDESHYITTHEIQLSELDHDTDYDFETESFWDIEDNNLACSFIDYASFDSEEKLDARRERSLARVKSNQVHANNTDRRGTGGAAVSTKPENDLCDTNKRVSSDESLSKNQNGSGNCAGQIHLSIKATSRAINEPSDVQGKENIRCYAKHQGDMSRHVFRRGDTKAEKICDSAKCFIAAPRRLHFGTKIKGKDINEYSSGASSAVSELDDADKEVRNLTARAFRSLACPYFDAINFSTSSESSASEHGLGINRWSAFVDLKYDMTRAKEKNLVSHKSATSTFEIDKNAGKAIKGLPLADIKAPQTKIFALNGNLPDPKNASSSTKKMELMGTFGKGRRGVITLTETLNFRCNVQAGVPGGERRAKFAQNATGSRSGDEVTCALPSRRGEAIRQPCNAGVSMEGAHKKAIFATSLLKNVISKKMQFEQERKMERGEICEPSPALSPYFFFKDHETHKEKRGDGARSVQRQTSKFSEAGSDLTVVCLDELADLADNNLCDPKDDSQREDTLTLASETNLEPTNEAGFNTKKGAFEASKSTLLRSQNSAFRSWKDGEQHFEKEHKNDKTPAGKPHSSTGKLGKTDVEIEVGGSRLTKMSHLFVPSIHIMPEERAIGNQPVNMKYSSRPAAHEAEEDAKVRSNSTLYVADTARSVVTSKSPEIKISLRSVKDSKGNPFNIAKLLTPNIGCNATSLIKTADDSKCQAQAVSLKGDAAEKVPHFMVRDIRDNKSKLQTPIHQVRDVRKLVKSSYHFVPSDANEFKTAAASDLLAEHNLSIPGPSRNPSSVSPIVIKCQSVNTNSNVKRSGNLIEVPKRRPADNITETERLSPQAQTEGANSGPILVHPSTSRAALATKLLNGDTSELPVEGKSEFVSAKRKLDKTTDTSEKKPESKMANQAALEKLQAAVKTMEQLYVFDRNEWKRKSEPQPIMDSHVLSLIASEEHEVKTELEEEDTGNAGSTEADVHSKHLLRSDSYSDVERSLASMSATELLGEDREQLKMLHIPFSWEDKDAPRSQSLQSEAFGSKNAFTFTHSQKPAASRGSTRRSQACPSSQTPFSTKTIAPKAAKETTPIKISHPKGTVAKREKHNNNEAENSVLANMSIMSNSENYLTIPVKSHPGDGKPAAAPMREQAVYTFTAARGQARAGSPSSQGGSQSNASRCDSSSQSPKRSTVVMEARSADTPTATIYHHSIPMAQPQVICFSSPPVPPTSSDPFQPTQRKMLLDPTTGHYYLVDTPIQPATRRLFDPETGQYVDVPMPQPPVAPLPMPMPPLALNPATYGPAYMIYPSFLPGPPVMPARPAPTLSVCTESEDGDGASVKTPQGDVAYLEGPYYIPTGKALQSQHVTTRGTKGVTNNKPIISITSQQGPRIIAPPSFDGTTMSFVVEHR